jgi:aspartate kinase
MIIIKFGGTSVATAQGIQKIYKIISEAKDKKPVVVVSAVAGITDLLLSVARSSPVEAKKSLSEIQKFHIDFIDRLVLSAPTKKDVLSYLEATISEMGKVVRIKGSEKAYADKIVSYGEILSSYIIAKTLLEKGLPTEQVIATDIIVTDQDFGSAEFLVKETRQKITQKIKPLLEKGIIPIITGFIGASIDGEVTTLGRGGSDYTAAILGFCLGASEIQVWKDVNGVYTTDPRLVKNAKNIPVLSYREASEMAFFGAKVLHPRTIRPAVEARIPVRVLNTFYPEKPGTLIQAKSKIDKPIKTISFKRQTTLVNICATQMLFSKGFLARIFTIFAENNTSIDLVAVSEVSVSVTLNNDSCLETAVKELSRFSHVAVQKNVGTISLIGEGIVASPHTVKKMFDVLDKKGIKVKMISLGATDINISIVIESDQVETAVKALHKTFFI